MKTQPEICEFDIRGQICPSSLLLVLREVNARREALMNESCQILVATDNRDATGTIPATIESMGLAAVLEKKDDHYQILIRKHANVEKGAK